MVMENDLPEEEKFSDHPEENLRLENEFLKMRMMVESGAIFGSESDNIIPPEIGNQFLKNVMEFERANAYAKPQKIFDLLGRPAFEYEKNLDDKKFQDEFIRLNKLLDYHNINVDFLTSKTDRDKYHFITRELFEHETHFIPIKGMSTNFIYEEFHPDHKKDIEEITGDFLNDFFDRRLSVDTTYIDDEIILPDGIGISKAQLINRFYSMYEVAVEFQNYSYKIEKIEFDINDEEGAPSAMGFSEGEIKYDMICKDGMRNTIHGPFKIYFGRQWESWNIYFFYLVGYNLLPK